MKSARSALFPVRAKWRNIGIELDIDSGTLDSIDSSYHYDHNECLTRMLEHWLKQIEQVSPPSWDVLADTLESSPIGERQLAEQIRQKYCAPHEGCNNKSEGAHTGKSSACIRKYVKYLKALYTSSNLPPDNKWPPTPSKHFINLACIDKQGITRNEADEFTRYSIQGTIDDICHKKTPISMEKVACMQNIYCEHDPSQVRVSYPKLILVGGAPGVGKTTFAWELCRRWSHGKLLQHYSLVVLLRLRDKSVREAKALTDVLFYQQKSASESLVTEILKNNGEGILFILEGFDELPESMRTESSLFLDLIYGRFLPLATILVTSRPWAITDIHWRCDVRISQHLEILGFTKQQIDQYLVSVSQGDSKLLDELHHYVSLNPPIHAAMYIPLNAAIVFEVYKDRRNHSDCIIPSTMTELYTAFSLTLLIRYHGDQGKKIRKVASFEDLPSTVYQKFLAICELASEGINNNQQLIFTDLPDDFETLGFMQSVPELHFSSGVSMSYNFLHLTIQEFLAAYHLSLQPAEVQATRKVGESVARFLAGLTKLNNPFLMKQLPKCSTSHYEMEYCWDRPTLSLATTESFNMPGIGCVVNQTSEIHYHDSRIINSIVESHAFLSRCTWFYESQNKTLLQTSIGTKTAFLKITSDMTPMECFAAGWCIGNSACKWKLCFKINQKGISVDCVEMLHAGIKHCMYASTSIDVCEIYVLVTGFGGDSKSEAVTLDKLFDLQNVIPFNVKKFVCISEAFLRNYIPSIHTLIEKSVYLHEVVLEFPCKDVYVQPLLDAVLANKSIECLKLGNEVSECFMKRKLPLNNSNICSLSLWFPYEFMIGNEATVETFTAFFIDCKSLKSLTIGGYPFHMHSMLLEQTTRTLDHEKITVVDSERITLCKNFPHDSGGVISLMFQETSSLETLNLLKCYLRQQDINIIAEAIKGSKSLLTLDLGENNCAYIGIAEILRVNQTLQALRLSGSNIDSTCLFQLFASNQNSTLLTLDVSNNNYSVKSLEDMLISNTSLRCLEITVTPMYIPVDIAIDADSFYSVNKGMMAYVDESETLTSICCALVVALNKNTTLHHLVIHTTESFNCLLVRAMKKCQYYNDVKERIKITQHYSA